jgi:hypothetical protein
MVGFFSGPNKKDSEILRVFGECSGLWFSKREREKEVM